MHHRFACSTSLMCNFYCTICADLCVKVIESCIDKKIQNPVMFTVYAQIIIHELETRAGLVIKVICFIDHRW